jgi:hypothetical protein
VSQALKQSANRSFGNEAGTSLVETMVSLTLMLIVSAGVMQALVRFSWTQNLVFGRSAMHDGVRSATELLQQEVGQAGSVSLPAGTHLTSAVTAVGNATVSVSTTTGMFVGENVVVGAGADEETVQIDAITPGTPGTFTGSFSLTHAISPQTPVTVRGGFATGIVPCASSSACPGSSVGTTTYANGSTGYLLKLYGDINDNGQMVYVEYKCDIDSGMLYRNVIENAVVVGSTPTKAAPGATQILLDNLTDPASGRVPCFVYQQATVGSQVFVVNVAISLTTKTQSADRAAGIQRETKSLLNVAPRNVFNAWLLASMGSFQRIQPIPASITSLLPNPS